MPDYHSILANNVMEEAKITGWRVGQTLFNLLPGGAANVVAGTTFDPFHKPDMKIQDVRDWIDTYLILNELNVIGVMLFNQILWEEK